MNLINNTLKISAYALLLTAGQTTLAEPSVGSAPDPSPEVFSAPTIEQVATPNSFESTVSYADLDLGSEEGVRSVYRLLQRASKEVCSGETKRPGRSVIMKSSRLQCYRQSLSKAVNTIDNENLTRFHAG